MFKSRAHRDRVNAEVMKDPRLAKMMDPRAMLLDCKRMVYGGFKDRVAPWYYNARFASRGLKESPLKRAEGGVWGSTPYQP